MNKKLNIEGLVFVGVVPAKSVFLNEYKEHKATMYYTGGDRVKTDLPVAVDLRKINYFMPIVGGEVSGIYEVTAITSARKSEKLKYEEKADDGVRYFLNLGEFFEFKEPLKLSYKEYHGKVLDKDEFFNLLGGKSKYLLFGSYDGCDFRFKNRFLVSDALYEYVKNHWKEDVEPEEQQIDTEDLSPELQSEYQDLLGDMFWYACKLFYCKKFEDREFDEEWFKCFTPAKRKKLIALRDEIDEYGYPECDIYIDKFDDYFKKCKDELKKDKTAYRNAVANFAEKEYEVQTLLLGLE